jgi:hypothetical protein
MTNTKTKEFLNSTFSIHNSRVKGERNGKGGNVIHGTMGGPAA